MNRIYGSIANRRTIAVSLMLAFGSNAWALPTGGAVSAGGASITSGPGTMTIGQTTQNAAINWQGFSIAQGEAVQFIQPSSSSVALNRVIGSDPSSILGSLSANGKVFLVNPNGILFGRGAQVNVGGLVASTLNISDADFMAGRYKFAGAGNGAILNQGAISADGGYVALLGASVSNEGSIVARLGTVALAAGNAVTLDVAGDGLLNVTIDQGAMNALVQNGGLIHADGGQVLMSAQGAGALLQTVVNNTGVIQARTLENRNGTIRLLADAQSGTVNVGGTLDVSGMGAGQTGGSITATGHHAGLFSGRIDASGDAGGGTVLVGGGYQGKDPAVQNAAATYMSTDSTISADAITHGNGGTVVLWSDGSTRASGTITARGGAQGGNGGLVETSGHWLDVWGITVSASAPNGQRGTWLLDPANVTIGAATTNATLTANVFSPNSGVDTATVGVADLRTALEAGGGTDVIITTVNTGAAGAGAGDITIASALTWTPVTSATLTLNADGDVNINAAVTTTRGNLVVCCGQDINVNAAITTTNGSVLLSAGRDVNVVRSALNPTAGVTTTDGNIAMCAGRNVNLANTFNGAALITLTRGSVVDGQDLENLGVARGLTLAAGNAGTGPGAAAGTVSFTGTALATVTGPDPVSPINIFYNPTSYATPTDYAPFFATGNGSPLRQFMLVYPDGGSKVFDGTTATVLSSLKGLPAGVTLVAGPGSAANFDTAAVGLNKTISFTGYTLAGANAANFALATTCCGPIVSRTTGNITAIAPVIPIVPLVVPVPPIVPALVLASSIPPGLIPEDAILPIFVTGLEDTGIVERPVQSLNLTVTQTVVPPVRLAQRKPPPEVVAPVPAPRVVPAPTPPVQRVPPRPARQDRN